MQCAVYTPSKVELTVQMLGDLLLAHIRQLFEWVLPPCLRFVRKNVKEIQPSLDTNLAQSCMRLFYSLLREFRPSGSEEAPVPPKGKLALLHPLPHNSFSVRAAMMRFCASLGLVTSLERLKCKVNNAVLPEIASR